MVLCVLSRYSLCKINTRHIVCRVYSEAEYAKALGKKLIGFKVAEIREISAEGEAFFNYDIVANGEEL